MSCDRERELETIRFNRTNKAKVPVMAINPTPRLVTELKPKHEIKVNLDDRSFLFSGRQVA